MENPRRSISGETSTLFTGWLGRLTNRASSSQRELRLEEIIDRDRDRDINIFSNDQLQISNPRRLYSRYIFSNNIGFFRYFRETPLHCPDNTKIRLPLITPEAAKEIKKTEIPIRGLILLIVRGLARKETWGKILLCLYDDRFKTTNEAIMGLIKVYMNNNIGISYIILDMMLTINDLEKHIRILVQVKGYDNFSWDNICLSIIFLRKIIVTIKKNQIEITWHYRVPSI